MGNTQDKECSWPVRTSWVGSELKEGPCSTGERFSSMVSHTWKGVEPADRWANWADLVTFKMHAPHDPEIPLLDYFCKMPKMVNAS